jgi:hypothetical protein
MLVFGVDIFDPMSFCISIKSETLPFCFVPHMEFDDLEAMRILQHPPARAASIWHVGPYFSDTNPHFSAPTISG